MEPLLVYPALFAVGFVAGVVNVIAGGGSFLTLPTLIFFGLPAVTANGTNRIAIIMQNAGAVWGFDRHRAIEWRFALRVVVPAVVGAGLGSWAALYVGDVAFRRLLATLMVMITLWTLFDPVNRRARRVDGAPGPPGVGLLVTFFLVGLYGGFIQAGTGFLVLAVTTAAGLDLVRGNAVKVLCILIWTPLALAIFAVNGHVDWGLGVAMGLGNLLGGQLGVHWTALKGHAWVRGAVTVTIVVFALRLWLL